MQCCYEPGSFRKGVVPIAQQQLLQALMLVIISPHGTQRPPFHEQGWLRSLVSP